MPELKEEVNVGDEKQVKKRKKSVKLIRENELEEIRQILAFPFGRRFLGRLLGRCHLNHTVSHHNSLDAARLSGERDVGLWLLDEINTADKRGYIKLVLEAEKREIDG